MAVARGIDDHIRRFRLAERKEQLFRLSAELILVAEDIDRDDDADEEIDQKADDADDAVGQISKHIARKLGQAGGDPVIEGVERVVDEILERLAPEHLGIDAVAQEVDDPLQLAGQTFGERGEAVNQLRNDHHAQHGNQGNAEQNRQRDGERLGNFLRLPLGLAALRQKGRKAQIEEHDDRVQQIRHGDAVKNRHDIADEPIDDSQNRVQPEHGDGKREHGGKDKKNEESLFERRRLVQPALRCVFFGLFFRIWRTVHDA